MTVRAVHRLVHATGHRVEVSDAAPDQLPRLIGAPARRALTAAGYMALSQLNGLSAAELQQLHGLGLVTLARLQGALTEQGMSLR